MKDKRPNFAAPTSSKNTSHCTLSLFYMIPRRRRCSFRWLPGRGKPLVTVGGFQNFLNDCKPLLGLRFGVELASDWEQTGEAGPAQRDIFVVAFKTDQQREPAVAVPDSVGEAG